MCKIYEVTLRAGSSDSFSGLQLNEDEYIEFDRHDNQNEVWKIYINRNIDIWLNKNENVKKYRNH